MARRSSGSESGAGAALFGLIAIAWFITTFFWWIVAGIAVVAGFHIGRALLRHRRAQRARHAAYCAALVARADQQHNWVLRGDARGIYGAEGAALMASIFD